MSAIKMQSVITQKQAKQITGGRTPHMPIEYEDAVRSLQACIDLDDAKYWSDKADALEAWAKIYRSKDAERKAKQLRLHAFRKMGQLAGELRQSRPRTGAHRGRTPGPFSLLREHGLSSSAAGAARRLASIPPPKFQNLVNARKVLSPIRNVRVGLARGSEAWVKFKLSAAYFTSFVRANNAADFARSLHADEWAKARAIVIELTEWLDAFEQALPKEKKAP